MDDTKHFFFEIFGLFRYNCLKYIERINGADMTSKSSIYIGL